jgi:hypothetical protein
LSSRIGSRCRGHGSLRRVFTTENTEYTELSNPLFPCIPCVPW